MESSMQFKLLFVALFMLGALAAGPVAAQAGHDHHGAKAATGTAVSSELYAGEVRRISKDTGKVTLVHGPLKAFDMPPMTMAFAVKDAAMLDRVKAGDKVQFALERRGNDLIVTRIEAVK
jgi:Cu(I)/Ag(I) efflux system periplasmic protein CusF